MHPGQGLCPRCGEVMSTFPWPLTALYGESLPPPEPGTTRALVPWWQRSGRPKLAQVACEACLASGEALGGKETTSRRTPSYLAYFDVMLDCKRCGEPFLFDALTQRSLYDEPFNPRHPSSRPALCAPCLGRIEERNHGTMDPGVFESNDLSAVLAAARVYARRRQRGPLGRLIRRARAIATDEKELAAIDVIEHGRAPRRWLSHASSELERRVQRGLARVARLDGLVGDDVELVVGRLVCEAGGGAPALRTPLWEGRSLLLGRSADAALRLADGDPLEPDLRLEVEGGEVVATTLGDASRSFTLSAFFPSTWIPDPPSLSLGGRSFFFERYLIGPTRDF